MLSFIAVCVQDEVVENDKLLAALHLDIYHLRSVLLHICYIFVAHRVGQLVLWVDAGEVIAACLSAVEIFADQNQVYEEKEAAEQESSELSDKFEKQEHAKLKYQTEMI